MTHEPPAEDLTPYDAVLLLSFGGPEGPLDVMPFLENVTKGRGVPPQRLAEVARHYERFGGRSPINDQNRALLAALRAELARRGVVQPVYWGNRNWTPYAVEALRAAHDDGARRVLVLVTSAYPSYSGCRQYREDLAGALAQLSNEGRALTVDKVRHFANHPGFVEPAVDAVGRAVAELPESSRDGCVVLFTTHSVPIAMNEVAGPEGGGYVAAHLDVATSIAEELGDRLGRAIRWELVYCSRSGPPQVPWLEPDVGERLARLAEEGVPGVVVAPIGFVSDHMEVVFDLDTEARGIAERLGVPFARAATAGTDRRFVAGLVDLLLERAAAERGESPPRPAVGKLGPWYDVCPSGCCRNLRGPQPAVCGVD